LRAFCEVVEVRGLEPRSKRGRIDMCTIRSVLKDLNDEC